MVRRMSEAGHVKRSIKIPDVFLQADSKPLTSTAAPHTPVLPYLAMEEFKKQREIDIRESLTTVKDSKQDSGAIGESGSTIDRSHAQQTQETPSDPPTTETIQSQAPPAEETHIEDDPQEPNHYTGRKYTAKPIPWSDRKGTSAPLPEAKHALAVQQGRYSIAEDDDDDDDEKPLVNLAPSKPLRPAPGEVYINEEGRRVRLVKKVRPRIGGAGAAAADGPKPRPRKRRNKSQRSGSQSSPTKAKGSSNMKPEGSTGPKKRRKKPRSAASGYPQSIGIPTDFEERSVQSELNLLSLGDLTPTEIAKMDPPSQSFVTPPCTPDSRDPGAGRTIVSSRALGKILFHKENSDRKAFAAASTNCGCTIL